MLPKFNSCFATPGMYYFSTFPASKQNIFWNFIVCTAARQISLCVWIRLSGVIVHY